MVVCLRRLGFGCCSWGVGLSLICYRSGQVWFWLFAYGVGLSLLCYRSISFAPVRGGTYFSLPAAKKSRQKKAGSHRQPVVSHPGLLAGTAQRETCPRAAHAGDKAVIRSSVALRAPPSGMPLPSAPEGGTTVSACRPAPGAVPRQHTSQPNCWSPSGGSPAFPCRPVRDARSAEWDG